MSVLIDVGSIDVYYVLANKIIILKMALIFVLPISS